VTVGAAVGVGVGVAMDVEVGIAVGMAVGVTVGIHLERDRGLEVALIFLALALARLVGQQHAHVVAAEIGGDEIGKAVVVEIGHGDGVGAIARREGGRGLEAAVAVAQQHAHVVAVVIGRHEIGKGVVVEIGHGDGAGPVAHLERDRGLEVALIFLALALLVGQQHAHVVAAEIGGDEVGDVVNVDVEIGHGDGARIVAGLEDEGAGEHHLRVRLTGHYERGQGAHQAEVTRAERATKPIAAKENRAIAAKENRASQDYSESPPTE